MDTPGNITQTDGRLDRIMHRHKWAGNRVLDDLLTVLATANIELQANDDITVTVAIDVTHNTDGIIEAASRMGKSLTLMSEKLIWR